MQYRLLALDVDGTLIDSSGRIRPRVREALARARGCGLEIVLCTGRRYRTARPLIEELAIDGPVVLHNGVLTKDARSGRTLAHRYLDAAVYADALALLRRQAASPLVYVDHYHEQLDILAEDNPRTHAFQAEYLADNAHVLRRLPSLDSPGSERLIMLSCMAEANSLLPLRREIERAMQGSLRTQYLMNRGYRGFILELTDVRSGKWPALRALAEREGIAAEEIVAIGDDENDAEMLEAAGLGIAMGNAVGRARRAADAQTASNDEDGLALALERFVLPAGA